MPRVTFESKITFGNVIQIGMLLVSLIAGWFVLVGNVNANSTDIAVLQKSVEPLGSLNVRLTVIESRAKTTDDQIGALVTAVDKLVDQMNSDRIDASEIRRDVGYLRDWVESIKREAKQ